jgi:hypothetical protein
MQKDLSILIQDADLHGPGMQVNATVEFVLFGVESHEVSSSLGCYALPSASIPRRYAEEGASISINMLQRTGDQRWFSARWYRQR